MNKTLVLYLILISILIIRVEKTCEGDLYYCQGISEMDHSPRVTELERLESFRLAMIDLTRKNLPSPHSELLLGMTIGIDRLYEIPKFKTMLRDTGTIHVVVVSGYNVTLVYNAIIKMIGSPYKTRNILFALLGTFAFAVVSGFEPPVVRAWLMGSMISLSKFYGRKINALSVLLVTGLILAIFNPAYIYNLSFQLSFLATLSLIMFESKVSARLGNIFKSKNIFVDDLSATISAQVLIWPYLSFKFEQVSLISPLVNALVLWTVPLATVVGSVFLVLGSLSGFLGALFAKLVYLPLDFFVVIIEFFSKFEGLVMNRKISLGFLLIYYLGASIYYLKKTKNND